MAVLFATSGKIIALTAEQKILVSDKVFWLRWYLIKGNTQGGIPLGSALLTFPRGKVSAARHERTKEIHLLRYSGISHTQIIKNKSPTFSTSEKIKCHAA